MPSLCPHIVIDQSLTYTQYWFDIVLIISGTLSLTYTRSQTHPLLLHTHTRVEWTLYLYANDPLVYSQYIHLYISDYILYTKYISTYCMYCTYYTDSRLYYSSTIIIFVYILSLYYSLPLFLIQTFLSNTDISLFAHISCILFPSVSTFCYFHRRRMVLYIIKYTSLALLFTFLCSFPLLLFFCFLFPLPYDIICCLPIIFVLPIA